ncbi:MULTISPECIES: FAD-dependent monooxygenase [unclassified Streptomyces]|uniref:FAD-dependent monooxygenase n=1 Tax=unclassified Streptomyces TaxID=2593676 RepID=UPI001BE82700|nr:MULTISPECIES: FAD-dependent monooxygenase [unclassified Streptomyces]MBT2402061.1 FAD-dependent monooxygenase [Streptomyces sp. ISL-21]MBT2609429.1 FAD-dependent monooxygenase [Streptomyces sp. ISL-87]
MGNTDTDVIIVGAGPVGLMLAGELRLAGVDCIVLERSTEPTDQSRALGFTARTIETFDQRGLLPRFGGFDTIPIGHFGGVPLDYREVEGGSYGAKGVPQSLTVAVLNDWAEELGVDIRRGWELSEFEADDDGVEADVLAPDGPVRLRAKYLVGCDGGRSTVRKKSGIGFPGHDARIEMCFAEVVGVQVRPRPNGERVPGGMVLAFQQGPDIFRVTYYEKGAVPREGDEMPSFTEVADAWERLTGENIRGGTPRWIGRFTDASRQASEYRRGRVLLAGDAAHIHLPIGGQGMSAGVQDAVNLGWKLAAEIHGHAPAGLLDSYHSERHPVGARVLINTLTQRALYISGEEMQPMRELFAELTASEDVRRHLIGMVTGLDIVYEVGPGDHPLLGRRLPDRELIGLFDESKTTAFELLHQARGVLLDLTGDAALRAAAAPWADRVDTVGARPHEARADDPFDGADAILVRPDGYVAWTGGGAGAGPQGLAESLTRWFGEPAAAAPGTEA